MRIAAILAAVVVLALVALTLVPEAGPYRFHLTAAALVVGAAVVVMLLADRGGRARSPAVKAEAVKPAPQAAASHQAAPHQAAAEVVSFLAILQDKGRFVDFLMDDITAYNDAQVGAAARIVHDGCKRVVQEHFTIAPVRDEAEGAKVTVPAGYGADEYRLVGRISGEAPFTGVLVHRGWRTGPVKLPRVLKSGGDRLPTIAPAEVELK